MSQTIDEKFRAFDAEHPQVWDEVLRLARILARKRKAGIIKWVSIAAVWERMRSNFMFDEKSELGDGYKLNNNYRALYARKLIETYPAEFDGVIEIRKRQSE